MTLTAPGTSRAASLGALKLAQAQALLKEHDLDAWLTVVRESAERPDPTFNTPTVAPIRRSTDADFTSWDASATYAVNPDVNVYGRVATGFRACGTGSPSTGGSRARAEPSGSGSSPVPGG